MSELLLDLQDAIIDGSKSAAVKLTETMMAQAVAPQTILDKGLVAGMSEVGELFKDGEYFVPELLVSARAMQASMDLLRPALADTGAEPVGTIVLGTVYGDIHDIGKNLAGMMLEGAGFRVVDIGVNATAEQFVDAVRTHNAQLVGISTLLTTTMTYAQEIIRALESAGLRDRVKVVLGGAPVTKEWAAEIGADSAALDAATGAEQCKALLLTIPPQ
jgi:5-methyltetrahydrofolate--homocysteine methyltransferase